MSKRYPAAVPLAGKDAEQSVDIERFAADVRAAEARIALLTRPSPDSRDASQSFVFDPLYLELATAMEMLRVAEEQLHQKTEELALARELTEIERRRYQELFDLAPDAYIITDEDGVVREANLAASQLLGVATQFLTGKSLSSFIDVESRREFRTEVESLKRAGATLHCRSAVRGAEATTIPISISAAPIRHGGRVMGIRWLIRDDSAHDAAESRLLQLSEELATRAVDRSAELQAPAQANDVSARGRQRTTERTAHSYVDLLGMVSHEVRTPLAAAHGYIELLRRGLRGDLTATQRADIESIAGCHEHLLRVLDNALAVARLDSGHLDLALTQIPLDAALQSLHSYVELDFHTRRVSYTCRAGDPSTLVLADREKLHQIMLNLLTNAVKFTRPGGWVTVCWSIVGQHIEIAVADDGVGIAPEDLDRVFEPYVRLGQRETTPHGFGLGLAISRKLARAMGGDVTVVSALNVGSTFTLTLPRAGRGSR